MATTGTPTAASEPADLANTLDGSALARIQSRADGDGLAAAAILGNALAELGIPRHLSVSPDVEPTNPDTETEAGAVTIDVRTLDAACNNNSLALCAYETAVAMGADPDPGMAIGGAITAHVTPRGNALADAEAQGLTERPGVAIPTPDLVSGLAHSSWLRAPFSGDEDATADFLDEHALRPIDGTEDRKRLASAIAFIVTESMAQERTTDALASALGPQTSPTAFETVGGYADVLRAVAARAPGVGLAALLDEVDEAALLDHWRSYGDAVHEAVSNISTDSDIATGIVEEVRPADVARLAHAYCVETKRVSVTGPTSIALAANDDAATSLLEAEFPDQPVRGTAQLATVRTDAGLEAIDSMSEVSR